MSNDIYYQTPEVTRRIMSNPHEDHRMVTVHTQMDCEPLIESVKQLREHHAVIGHRKSSNMVPVCEVPMTVYEQAFREGWLHDKQKWRDWANQAENKCFRITDGRV